MYEINSYKRSGLITKHKRNKILKKKIIITENALKKKKTKLITIDSSGR